jgi:hypothetical protein
LTATENLDSASKKQPLPMDEDAPTIGIQRPSLPVDAVTTPPLADEDRIAVPMDEDAPTIGIQRPSLPFVNPTPPSNSSVDYLLFEADADPDRTAPLSPQPAAKGFAPIGPEDRDEKTDPDVRLPEAALPAAKPTPTTTNLTDRNRPIVTCAHCRSTFDPGVNVLEDGPIRVSQRVVCPSCEKWTLVPENLAIQNPTVSPTIFRAMIQQAKILTKAPLMAVPIVDAMDVEPVLDDLDEVIEEIPELDAVEEVEEVRPRKSRR